MQSKWLSRVLSRFQWRSQLQRHGKALSQSGLIWPEWYKAQYADVGLSSINPLEHYIRFGASEGRNPSLLFDGNRYLNDNPDVAESGINPLLHYVIYGKNELRRIYPVAGTPAKSAYGKPEKIVHRPGIGAPELSIVMPIRNVSLFIQASLPSILGQTGCIAEILISDDCSSDDTLQLVLEIVNRYSGPHTITLFYSLHQLGIDHLVNLIEMASQDWIVQAHGDDVSYPQRAARLLAIHRKTGASLIGSRAIDSSTKELMPFSQKITGEGWLQIDSWLVTPLCVLAGAVNAFSRRIYEQFPRLDSNYAPIGHDVTQAFRASLFGGVWYTEEALLERTMHKDQWSRQFGDGRGLDTRKFSFALRRLSCIRVMRKDFAHAHAANAFSLEKRNGTSAILDKASDEMLECALAAKEELDRMNLVPFWLSPNDRA